MFFQYTRIGWVHTLLCVRMFFFSTESFTGNANTGKLQVPENDKDHHQRKAGDDLPQTAPVFANSIQLFQQAFSILWQDRTSFPKFRASVAIQ